MESFIMISKNDSISCIETASLLAVSSKLLRVYPKSPVALNDIHAHAKCSIAR